MADTAPTKCPRCGCSSVDTTTMGVTLTDGRYDDGNRATCTSCQHTGKVGDWQRLHEMQAKLRALCDAVQRPVVHVHGFKPKLFVSEENSDLILFALREAREVLNG